MEKKTVQQKYTLHNVNLFRRRHYVTRWIGGAEFTVRVHMYVMSIQYGVCLNKHPDILAETRSSIVRFLFSWQEYYPEIGNQKPVFFLTNAFALTGKHTRRNGNGIFLLKYFNQSLHDSFNLVDPWLIRIVCVCLYSLCTLWIWLLLVWIFLCLLYFILWTLWRSLWFSVICCAIWSINHKVVIKFEWTLPTIIP